MLAELKGVKYPTIEQKLQALPEIDRQLKARLEENRILAGIVADDYAASWYGVEAGILAPTRIK